jgi:hypothetical protein
MVILRKKIFLLTKMIKIIVLFWSWYQQYLKIFNYDTSIIKTKKYKIFAQKLSDIQNDI